MRDLAVQMKLIVIPEIVRGKRVIVVEDSIVRGTTTRGKMLALRRAGAKEIHMRVSCPPIRHPCFFGIDFPTPTELIANGRTVDQIRDFIEVDSLAYLSLEGMLKSHGQAAGELLHGVLVGELSDPGGSPAEQVRDGTASDEDVRQYVIPRPLRCR